MGVAHGVYCMVMYLQLHGHDHAISAPCEVKKYDMAKNMTQARLSEAYMFIDTTEPNEKEEEQSLGRELES